MILHSALSCHTTPFEARWSPFGELEGGNTLLSHNLAVAVQNCDFHEFCYLSATAKWFALSNLLNINNIICFGR
jgi:hypothetical protein